MERLSQVIDSVLGAGDKADVDIEIEQVLRAELLGLLDCDFWGEETESRLTGADYCWVVDPNDGAADFLKGNRGSAVSVGLLRNEEPVLGVVYAPVTDSRGPDCIVWEVGIPSLLRKGQQVQPCWLNQILTPSSKVLVSTAARTKPELNAELCFPAGFIPMPSIAYRLALAAAGDAIVGISLVPVGAHDVVAGHALLIGAHGVLLSQDGNPITYQSQKALSQGPTRCFGGAPEACKQLARRRRERLFSTRTIMGRFRYQQALYAALCGNP